MLYKKKNPPKFHDKAVQSNLLWLNLNKINEISILQLAHKQGNPSFHFHAPGSERRYPLKQHGLSKNISPVCSSFLLVIASGMHLESESAKRAKNVDFHIDKNIQIHPTFFSLSLDEFLETDLQPIHQKFCQK